MRSEGTRTKLINVITTEITRDFNVKLKIQDICEAAGISRQAFNRYYADLKPYIKREKPISELVTTHGDTSSKQLLCKYQSKIEELQEQLYKVKKSQEEELIKVKNNMTTSLMNNDLAIYDADRVRQQLQSQSLHADKLKEKINSLEMELSKK
ncbi:hypothetical protein LCGC14_2247780, partial [marine sediment metagenome]